MPGLKTIYTKDGTPLTDIRASVARSSLLNDIGEASFSIPITDAKCKREYLEYGNFIVIQHDTLPDWVGIIDTPRIWHHGFVEVHAFEAPFILKYRYPPLNASLTGTPSVKFSTLLDYANAQGDTLIRVGNTSDNSIASEEVVSDSVYSCIDKIRENNDMDWICQPKIDANGKLTVIMDFIKSAGISTEIELAQGKNILYGEIPLEESGELVNSVEAVTDGSDAVSTYTYTETANYGIRVLRNVFTGASSDALADYAKQMVKAKKDASFSTPLTVLNVGNVFENTRLGNVMKYKYTNVGFDEAGLGASQYVRIEGFRFDEVLGTCELFTGKVK